MTHTPDTPARGAYVHLRDIDYSDYYGYVIDETPDRIVIQSLPMEGQTVGDVWDFPRDVVATVTPDTPDTPDTPAEELRVNGHTAETGCYIQGSWWQYGPDRLAEVAEGFDWIPADCFDDPRELRKIIDAIEDWGYTRGRDVTSDSVGIVATFWECHMESAERIEAWLNDHTSEGFSWSWFDGEFFLMSDTDWQEWGY